LQRAVRGECVIFSSSIGTAAIFRNFQLGIEECETTIHRTNWKEFVIVSVITGKEILGVLFGSEARVDLVSLFRKNPGLVDSIDGVARRMGRNASVIQSDVAELMKLGILRGVNIGGKQVLSLDRLKDSEIQRIVDEFTKESSQDSGLKV
jgi:hypothetical protein